MRRGLLISILLLPCLAWADSSEEIQRLRHKNGVWSGLSVTTGSLSMRAPTAQSRIKLTALPGFDFGMEQWGDDTIGFQLRGSIGLPATISNVLAKDVGVTQQHLYAGWMFRRFMGLRASASAWSISSNVRLQIEDVQEQRPSILVSRTILSPNLKVAYEHFIVQGVWWMRAGLGASYPFFVRESPTDSGRPDDMMSFNAQWMSCYYLNSTWGLFAQFAALYQSFEHGGEATRAGGVNDVAVTDHYLTGLVGFRLVSY